MSLDWICSIPGNLESYMWSLILIDNLGFKTVESLSTCLWSVFWIKLFEKGLWMAPLHRLASSTKYKSVGWYAEPFISLCFLIVHMTWKPPYFLKLHHNKPFLPEVDSTDPHSKRQYNDTTLCSLRLKAWITILLYYKCGHTKSCLLNSKDSLGTVSNEWIWEIVQSFY